MGRKNSKVRRSNDKGRLSRRQQGEVGRPKKVEQPRVRVEDMVMPDGQCRFQSPRKPKARFATPEKAAKALTQAQHQRARTGSTHVEKRFYKCPEVVCEQCKADVPKTEHTCPPTGCGGYHLTSRDEFDEKIWRERRALRTEVIERTGGEPQ